MTTHGCTARCWAPIDCTTCGRELSPRGRSVSHLYESPCCWYAKFEANHTRHLWDEHDDVRFYTDPDGWNAHVAACVSCSRTDETDNAV